MNRLLALLATLLLAASCGPERLPAPDTVARIALSGPGALVCGYIPKNTCETSRQPG